MKRFRSIIRWLGTKRLIGSAVLGVVFPLLFAAWVASEPGMIRSALTRFEQTQYYQTDDAMGFRTSRPATRMDVGITIWSSDIERYEKFESLFLSSNSLKLGRPSLDSAAGDMTVTDYRYSFGWPLTVIRHEFSMLPSGQIIAHNADMYVPPGWWSNMVGPGDVPLRVIPTNVAANWLFYAPIFYLLLSMPRTFRHTLRTRRGLCTRCGYDLAGLASCPECGKDRP